MAITQDTYTGNGVKTNYTFTFPYIEEDDVKVSLDGVDTTAYTFANATTIQFNAAPGNGVAIRIYRNTSDENLSAVFYSGSAIRSQDLNNNFTQALYVAQETRNTTIQASTGNLADGSITSNLIANDAVSNSKLGANSVTTAKIADANVTEAKLSFTPLKSTDIGVTVQGYDATTLKSADIGTTVQAYDADTAKTDTAQTFTAEQIFNAGISLDGPFEQASEAITALNVDCSAGNYFTKAISSNSTFTFSNIPTNGTVYGFTLEVDVTGASTAITWPASVKWSYDAAPTLTDIKTHLFMFVTNDGGTTWRGSALVDYTT